MTEPGASAGVGSPAEAAQNARKIEGRVAVDVGVQLWLGRGILRSKLPPAKANPVRGGEAEEGQEARLVWLALVWFGWFLLKANLLKESNY